VSPLFLFPLLFRTFAHPPSNSCSSAHGFPRLGNGGMKTWLRRLSRLPQMASFAFPLSFSLSQISCSSIYFDRTLNWRSGNFVICVLHRGECEYSYSGCSIARQLADFRCAFEGIETSTITNVSLLSSTDLQILADMYSSHRNEKHLGSRRSCCSSPNFPLPPRYVEGSRELIVRLDTDLGVSFGVQWPRSSGLYCTLTTGSRKLSKQSFLSS